VLDEASSRCAFLSCFCVYDCSLKILHHSLDVESEEAIREVIRTDLAGRTIIAVAHRLATIVDFDQIVVMEDGVVAEHGSPQQLLARPQSRFAQLAATQGLIPTTA
jgi:ATP-binding cassette, subfamily C (CFTR/MRP), member 1